MAVWQQARGQVFKLKTFWQAPVDLLTGCFHRYGKDGTQKLTVRRSIKNDLRVVLTSFSISQPALRGPGKPEKGRLSGGRFILSWDRMILAQDILILLQDISGLLWGNLNKAWERFILPWGKLVLTSGRFVSSEDIFILSGDKFILSYRLAAPEV